MPSDALLKDVGRYARAAYVERLVAGLLLMSELGVLDSPAAAPELRSHLVVLFDTYTVADAPTPWAVALLIFVALLAYLLGLVGEYTAQWVANLAVGSVVHVVARVQMLRRGTHDGGGDESDGGLPWEPQSESLWFQLLLGPAPNARHLWSSLQNMVSDEKLAAALDRLPMPLGIGEDSHKKLIGSISYTTLWLSRYTPNSLPSTRLLLVPGLSFVPVLVLG